MENLLQLRATIDKDQMCARVTVPEGFDRTRLNPELCDTALRDAGVELTESTKQLIDQFIGESAVATPGPITAVVAKGMHPRHGKDGRVEWIVDQAAPEPGAEEQAVSFYDRSAYVIVKAGDTLGRVHQATPGEDGRDVTGKTIAARDGKALEFKYDETLCVDRAGQIVAQADGVLDRKGPAVCIRDCIEVDQYVDFNTGNIAFCGKVIIKRGVRDCFKVEADGDVEVHGLIEAATIVTGGDLRALGGFAGREQGAAEVAGNLLAKYLDAVNVSVRGDLCVDREIINCNSTVLGNINSPTGAIIGGQTHVAGTVEVNELGSEGYAQTTVHLGGVPHLDPLINKLERVAHGLNEQRVKLVEEQELIQKASGKWPTADHKERLCELMFEIAEAQTQLERAEPALNTARAKADAMRRVELRVHKKLYPNTVLVCAGLSYKVKDEIAGPMRIAADKDGRLHVEPEHGPTTPLSRRSDLREAA